MNTPLPVSNLNTICPYYTMFPLDFPLSVLTSRVSPGEWVLDPFCGRGTTNFSARLLGLNSVGIDSSPVAVAIAAAKLASAAPEEVVEEARHILASAPEVEPPDGAFWSLAYHPDMLVNLCRLRAALIEDCSSDVRKLLRAVLLGALHGPVNRHVPSYFSNQCPRTFAPKPRYAVKYWTQRNLVAPPIDILRIVEQRAHRALRNLPIAVEGQIVESDSRTHVAWTGINVRFRWIVTSPPYYGMTTYLPDQWLRHWFVGGPTEVFYGRAGQVSHHSPEEFANDLATVWGHAATKCDPRAEMVVRFGVLGSRNGDPMTILLRSLVDTGWQVLESRPAGSPSRGRRQADQFGLPASAPTKEELDVRCRIA